MGNIPGDFQMLISEKYNTGIASFPALAYFFD
jgi:hypothetical protein